MAEPLILDYVYARLSAMRVDSCTNEVKECLQSDDRCGADYTQCIGLDTDTIIRMCPYDKLVGCQKVYQEQGVDITGQKVYDELATMVQGIMLNIDNNFLNQCQNAANEAMIKVCGSTEDCNGIAVDENIGARSLEYKICEYKSQDGEIAYNAAECRVDVGGFSEKDLREKALAGVLTGLIFWDSVDFDEMGNLISIDEYLENTGLKMSETDKTRTKSELGLLQQSINNAIQAIESDAVVQFCMTGRKVQGMESTKGRTDMDSRNAGRFPGLTGQMRLMIATAALQEAKANYLEKYDALYDKIISDFSEVKAVAELADTDNLNVRRKAGRVACLNSLWGFAGSSQSAMQSLDTSSVGQEIGAAKYNGTELITPYTSGANALTQLQANAVGVAGKRMTNAVAWSTWNSKYDNTATYDWENLSCRVCKTTTNCATTRHPWFHRKYCDRWGEPQTSCKDLQY